MERNNVSFLKPRAIGLIIKASGLLPSTIAFIALFLVCSVLVALFEPNVNGFANSLWFMFQVVTTIGLGDFTATSFVGRAAAVVLSVYSVFFLALITGAVVSYCQERMAARRDESVAHFIDQLEHLPELSRDELAELSEKVKRIDGRRR
jgi:voltage-gated potassium channel